MIQGIVSGLIVLIVLLIQIADSRISEYNNKLLSQQSNLNLQLGRGYHSLLNNYFYRNFGFFISTLNPAIEIDSSVSLQMQLTGFQKSDSGNEIRSDLWAKVKKGESSVSDYFYDMSELYSKEYKTIYGYYHEIASQYKINKDGGTVWTTLKQIFVIVLFILIFINLFGYAVLFNSISGRVKK